MPLELAVCSMMTVPGVEPLLAVKPVDTVPQPRMRLLVWYLDTLWPAFIIHAVTCCLLVGSMTLPSPFVLEGPWHDARQCPIASGGATASSIVLVRVDLTKQPTGPFLDCRHDR